MDNKGKQIALELSEIFYNRAFEDGYNFAQLKKSPEGSYTYKQGYTNGQRDQLNELWDCARRIMFEIPLMDIEKIFGCNHWQDLFTNYTGEEIINCLRKWDKK